MALMLVVELKVQSQPIVIVHVAGPGRSNRLEKVMTAVGMVKEADARKTRLLFRQADFQPETVKACRIYRLTIHRSHHVCGRPFASAHSAILLLDGRVESEPEQEDKLVLYPQTSKNDGRIFECWKERWRVQACICICT